MKKAWRTISSSVRTPYFGTFRGRVDVFTRRTRRTLRRMAFGSVLVTIAASAAAAALLVGSLAPPTDTPRQALPETVEDTAPLAPVEVADEPGVGRLAAPEAATEFLGSEAESAGSETTSISTTTTTALGAAPQVDVQVAVDATVPSLDVDGSVPGGPATAGVVEVSGTITAGSGDGIQPQVGDVEVPVSDPAPPPVIIYPPDIPTEDGPLQDEEPPVISDPVEIPDLEVPDDTTDEVTDTVDDADGADEIGDAIDTPAPGDTVGEVTNVMTDEVTDAVDEIIDGTDEVADATDIPVPSDTSEDPADIVDEVTDTVDEVTDTVEDPAGSVSLDLDATSGVI